MESGGKAVTKRCRKKITVVLSLILPVIVLFAISNCFTTYVFYEDYKYKMKLLKQFLIILAISFVGEILKYLLPLPVPASIYGMVILFISIMFFV